MNRFSSALLIAAISLTGACQTAAAPDTPARLMSTDNETMMQVKSVLASALGRATVELGPGDLTTDSTISVLPAPLALREDRSMATPILFDLRLSGATCYAVRRDSGETFPLGVACAVAE